MVHDAILFHGSRACQIRLCVQSFRWACALGPHGVHDVACNIVSADGSAVWMRGNYWIAVLNDGFPGEGPLWTRFADETLETPCPTRSMITSLRFRQHRQRDCRASESLGIGVWGPDQPRQPFSGAQGESVSSLCTRTIVEELGIKRSITRIQVFSPYLSPAS